MALVNDSTSDRPDHTLAFHAVAYLDFLGQKALLRSLQSLPRTPEDEARTLATLRETAGRVLAVRRSFRDMLGTLTNLDNLLASLPEEIRELGRQMREMDVGFRGMSDSLVVTAAMQNDNEHCRAVNGVFALMFSTAAMVATGFAAETPIRGGIDVGLGIDLEGDEVYGPALARAYDLESGIADYPRVVLGRELLVFLNGVSKQEPRTVFGKSAQDMSTKCLELVTTDTDGLPMLDFLGEGRREIAGDDFDELVTKGSEFVRNSHERFTLEGDLKLASRYGRLRRYYESRSPGH